MPICTPFVASCSVCGDVCLTPSCEIVAALFEVVVTLERLAVRQLGLPQRSSYYCRPQQMVIDSVPHALVLCFAARLYPLSGFQRSRDLPS